MEVLNLNLQLGLEKKIRSQAGTGHLGVNI